MNFGKIIGKISYVPLERYEELISIYIDQVSKVQGVKSIVQIGSFTAPGLSDIDLIVIVDDDHPPRFEDISIKKILANKPGAEVIAHDVFIYPASLSKYIEGLFYIDQKKTLFGDPIGGYLPTEKVDKLKLILSFEYSIHRLESLVAMTATHVITIRNVLLFISTLRHTFKLLADFNIITLEECNQKVSEIEELRNASIDNDDQSFSAELNTWIMPCFRTIYDSSIRLGEKLRYRTSKVPKTWILNSKKLIFFLDKSEEAEYLFLKIQSVNKKFRGKVTIEPMPHVVYSHIQNYEHTKLSQNNINKLAPLDLRYNLAVKHAEFLTLRQYPIARTYTIIDNNRRKFTDHIKTAFLEFITPILTLKLRMLNNGNK